MRVFENLIKYLFGFFFPWKYGADNKASFCALL